MDGIPVTYVALALLTAVALISFVRSAHYAWMRHRRRRYPGDIELTPQGIRQRVADRVVEVSWQDINLWEGGRRSNIGGSLQTFGMRLARSRFVDLEIENRNDTRVSVRRTSKYS